MVRQALAALCALLAMDTAQAQGPATCPLKLLVSFDTLTMPDGRITVPVQFEGHDHRLMVDTGGFVNTVTLQLAREEGYKIRLSHGTVLRGVGARSLLSAYVDTTDFTIGHSHGEDFAFFVEPFDYLSMDGTLAPAQSWLVHDTRFRFRP